MSLVLDYIGDKQSRILVWKDEEELQFFRERVKLSQYDHDRLAQYTVKRRQKDLLIARYLLQSIYPNAKVAYHPNGKPYLTDNRYQISISHSRELVAVIAHPSTPVAIDIEYISSRVNRVKQRFLSKRELAEYTTTEQHTLLWSAKECLFKIDTQQGIDFKKDLELTITNNYIINGVIRNSHLHQVYYKLMHNWVLCYIVK